MIQLYNSKCNKCFQRPNQSTHRRNSTSTSLNSSSSTMKTFSTEGYNFNFNFDAKNTLKILTNEKNYISPELMYDPSSPTQSENDLITPALTDKTL